jgi:cytochrome c oxidase subunit 2
MRAQRLILWLAGSVLLGACGASAGQGEDRAEVIFADNCGVCHGPSGQGNASIAAPVIAGLPQWYVEAQLGKFRDGIRGAHADDAEGLRMRPMSRTILPKDVTPVAAYVASMSLKAPDRELAGDAKAGEALYAPCLACHGPDGKGQELLKAPPIVQLDDWYIASTLRKFRSGVRGANPRDITGMQMAPMAKTLKTDDDIVNVVAYIGTLSGGQ